MLNRCIRQDQWDWLTVYCALGRPPYHQLRDGVEWLIPVRDAMRDADGAAVAVLRKQATAAQVLGMLQRFESALQPLSTSCYPPGSLVPITMPARAKPASVASDGEPYILSIVSRVKHERANASHTRTLALLVQYLRDRGIDVQSNDLIDAFASLPKGGAIFEVKSITADNERSQCRSALAQLTEYQYLHRLSTASLWVVLSARPTIPWMEDYLRSHCKLRLLWVDPTGSLAGPDLQRLG